MTIRFTSTVLDSKGKKGTLTPDDDGYYEVVLGGLNTYNSMGEFYTGEGLGDLFTSSSVFMRRVMNGNLKGELGHPKRKPGMTDDEYINLLFRVDDERVCMHISEVWLDEDYGKNNPELNNHKLIAIMGKITPSGPHGEALRKSLENPKENVCFSIRAITDDYYRGGKVIRVLDKIQCWDQVNEPGISISNKYSSPATEAHVDLPLTKKKLEKVSESLGNDIAATEDSKEFVYDAMNIFNSNSISKFKDW